MGEFIQNYGIWIVVIGGMFLMHRLGIGCHGHGHGRDHGRANAPKTEPSPTETAAVVGEEPGAAASTGPPGRLHSR